MSSRQQADALPTDGIWRRFALLVPLLVVLIIASRAYIRSVGSDYDLWTPLYANNGFSKFDASDVTMSNPGVVEVAAVTHGANNSVCLSLHALKDGETDLQFGNDQELAYWFVRVENGVIFEGGADFSGWESIHLSICIFLVAAIALFASVLIRLWRSSWYGYEMVASGGALLFLLFELALFVLLYTHSSLRSFSDIAYELTSSAGWFVVLSIPPAGIVALLVALSNISLIRHEGLRPVNLLGIAAGIAWLAAIVFYLRLSDYFSNLLPLMDVFRTVDSVFAAGVTFGECLLLSTIVCAWLAAHHEPAHGADYLVILGCGLRADGTPCPLLAGRVDRARTFDERRVSLGDAPATYVPSGGQGPDEVMSEAESMRNYLVASGVAPERIVQEGRSATTRENMAFSREVIEEHAGCDVSNVRVVFSTTNYHVFRGYVCAHQAGMAVEGLGSKTKAYFWPNAFLREFVGLLATQWKGIAQVFLILAAIYVLAERTLLFV